MSLWLAVWLCLALYDSLRLSTTLWLLGSLQHFSCCNKCNKQTFFLSLTCLWTQSSTQSANGKRRNAKLSFHRHSQEQQSRTRHPKSKHFDSRAMSQPKFFTQSLTKLDASNVLFLKRRQSNYRILFLSLGIQFCSSSQRFRFLFCPRASRIRLRAPSLKLGSNFVRSTRRTRPETGEI